MDYLVLPPLHAHFAFKQTIKKNMTLQQKHITFIVTNKIIKFSLFAIVFAVAGVTFQNCNFGTHNRFLNKFEYI